MLLTGEPGQSGVFGLYLTLRVGMVHRQQNPEPLSTPPDTLMNQNAAEKLRRWLAEFTVIVLGVLTALGVDEWREYRADRGTEAVLLGQFQEDVESDLAQLAQIQASSQRQMLLITNVLRFLDDPLSDSLPFWSMPEPQPGTEVESIEDLARVMDQIVRPTSRLDHRRGTYDEALATGTLRTILQPELRTKIVAYYANVAERLPIHRDAAEAGVEELGSLIMRTDYMASELPMIPDPAATIAPIEPELRLWLRRRRQSAWFAAFFLGSTQEAAEGLLNSIRDAQAGA